MDIKEFIEKYKTYALIGAALTAFSLYQLTEEEEPALEPLAFEGTPMEERSTPPPAEPLPQEPAVVMVDIKGAVASPGIYSLKNGQRINDAVAKAGGFQKEADRTAINLAQKLQDEMIIYVPKVGEEPPAELVAANAPAQPVKESAKGSSAGSGSINVNTATVGELQELPGIGEAKAQAIIDYRETTGAFSKPEDLKNVSGIGEKTFEKLAPLIAVH